MSNTQKPIKLVERSDAETLPELTQTENQHLDELAL